MEHSTSYHVYHKVARRELSKAQTKFILSHQIKNPQTKNQPMLGFSSANDHKNNIIIEFGSLLEVTKSTMQVKPSIQMLILPQPNASSTVLSELTFLNSYSCKSRTFT